MKVLQTLRFDLEELDALRLATNNGDVLSEKYRSRYTPNPATQYYSQIQKVKKW